MEFIEDFEHIVIENIPLLDVRAPIEFKNGAFPNSTNIPILNNSEREKIGIRYKEAGNQKAIELAKEIVAPFKEERLDSWVEFFKNNPNAYLYCFRGGSRSKYAKEWLQERSLDIPRLKGGYKAFRNFLMQRSLQISSKLDTIIIGGRTGSGKTPLVNEFDNSIDLEALANHRGSAFGKKVSSQPCQIDFENSLYYALIRHYHYKGKSLIIEHESKNIGRLYIPKEIYANFTKGKLIILKTPMPDRLENIYNEYVKESLAEYQKSFGENYMNRWEEDVLASLKKIEKRLGSKLYLSIKNRFLQINQSQNLQDHKEWIEDLLENYYDKMYDYQIQKSSIEIVFEGDRSGIREFLRGLP